MSDATLGYRKPSIADIKVGAITYDPTAGPEKIREETCKYPPVKELGFRILGLKVVFQSILNPHLYIQVVLFVSVFCLY